MFSTDSLSILYDHRDPSNSERNVDVLCEQSRSMGRSKLKHLSER